MTRHIVLGNGSLLVNIDKWLQVRDIYYPHVGQENHLLGHSHKISVLVDNKLSWINDDAWHKTLAYEEETLVSDTAALHDQLKCEIKLNDCVHFAKNVFLRKVVLRNYANHNRTFKVFFHHDFHLYGDGIGDTAGYDPIRNAVFHYKRSRYFLINAVKEENLNRKQESGDIADYHIGAADGKTVEDAADGALSKNAIAQGSVDSIISIELEVKKNSCEIFYYWICCGQDFREIHDLNNYVVKQNPKKLLFATEQHWRKWVNSKKIDFHDLDESLIDAYKRSLLVIRTQMDKDGAIIAANDSDNIQYNADTYSYMWPRDGALVAIALQKAGFATITKKFYLFCRDVLSEYGCFLHKYNPDKSLGSSWHPWIRRNEFSLPIQEDETGLVIHALWHYYQTTRDKKFLKNLYKELVKPAADFMVSYRDKKTKLPLESYDLWEERHGVSAFAASAVYRGLESAASIASLLKTKDAQKYKQAATEMHEAVHRYIFDEKEKRFVRNVCFTDAGLEKDYKIDSTLLSLFEFHCINKTVAGAKKSMNVLKEKLWVNTEIGGIARYQEDYYHHKTQDWQQVPGNPWLICTIWLAKWYVKIAESVAELQEARTLMLWVDKYSLDTGIMPEQIHPYTGEPLSVSPLTWSHAEYVELVVDYCTKLTELKRKAKKAVKKR